MPGATLCTRAFIVDIPAADDCLPNTWISCPVISCNVAVTVRASVSVYCSANSPLVGFGYISEDMIAPDVARQRSKYFAWLVSGVTFVGGTEIFGGADISGSSTPTLSFESMDISTLWIAESASANSIESCARRLSGKSASNSGVGSYQKIRSGRM